MGYESHHFFENRQNLMLISKMHRKIEKKSFIFEIMVSELVALNFLNKEDNTSHLRSMC